MAQFSAAWFKIYLDETPEQYEIDFSAMIYGTGADGVCSGGHGTVTACTVEK